MRKRAHFFCELQSFLNDMGHRDLKTVTIQPFPVKEAAKGFDFMMT